METILLVSMYLAAIVAANLIVTWLGPWVSPYTAGLFIGLDLTVKDKLQDKWTKRGLTWRMGSLILAGSVLSWLINRKAGQIAVASFVAFAVSTAIDTIVYALCSKQEKWRKVGWSNLAGALSDSIIFPIMAFGWPPDPAIIYGQMAAKVSGGQLWTLILIKRASRG